MCTLIALHRCVAGAPLIVAANRDEFLDRPSLGPSLRQTRAGRWVAPHDARAGGTWLGLNEHGVFAAVTNRPCSQPDRSRRSRGLLVLDALVARSAPEAADRLDEIATDAYNPFNLFVADANAAFACVYDGRPGVRALAPGAHVIGNVEPDSIADPKVGRLLALAEKLVQGPAESVPQGLVEICRAHDGGGALEDTCIHAGGYGTRSSSILRIGATVSDSFWWFADGAPCVTGYEDFTHLLYALGQSTGAGAGERAARAVT